MKAWKSCYQFAYRSRIPDGQGLICRAGEESVGAEEELDAVHRVRVSVQGAPASFTAERQKLGTKVSGVSTYVFLTLTV